MHTHTAVIFSALMLCCLCHRPFCAPTSPPDTFVTASLNAEQRGTVYISAKLALPFGPSPRSHYIFTFQAFSWHCHLQQESKEVSKQVEKPQTESMSFLKLHLDRMHGSHWIGTNNLFWSQYRLKTCYTDFNTQAVFRVQTILLICTGSVQKAWHDTKHAPENSNQTVTAKLLQK